jgi:hypothetical protein
MQQTQQTTKKKQKKKCTKEKEGKKRKERKPKTPEPLGTPKDGQQRPAAAVAAVHWPCQTTQNDSGGRQHLDKAG